jgi:tetratricopeptide (TPR) repeat protein
MSSNRQPSEISISKAAKALAKKAHAAAKIGNVENAISLYGQAIELSPDYASAYNNRGLLHEGNGDHEKAMADFNIAAKLGHVSAFNNRGILCGIQGNIALEILNYIQALKRQPDCKDANDNLKTVLTNNSKNTIFKSISELPAEDKEDGETLRAILEKILVSDSSILSKASSVLKFKPHTKKSGYAHLVNSEDHELITEIISRAYKSNANDLDKNSDNDEISENESDSESLIRLGKKI